MDGSFWFFKERYNFKITGKTKNFVRKIFDVILNIQNFCCYEMYFCPWFLHAAVFPSVASRQISCNLSHKCVQICAEQFLSSLFHAHQVQVSEKDMSSTYYQSTLKLHTILYIHLLSICNWTIKNLLNCVSFSTQLCCFQCLSVSDVLLWSTFLSLIQHDVPFEWCLV